MTFATDVPVRIGVQLPPQHVPYATLRDSVAQLEQLGVDIVFNWDHFYPLFGEPEGLHFESWSMLAAIAEQTSRIELGPLVNCNSYRNPDLQADMARTIDHISAKDGVGRFIFGTGSGWFEKDYDEYGYEFGTVGSRLNALAEDLPRIRARWAKLNPAPTREIPILIGGGGEKKTLKIVAQHANIWHSFATGENLDHKLSILADHCATVGRDPKEITISAHVGGRNGHVDESVLDGLHGQGVRVVEYQATPGELDVAEIQSLLAWRDRANA